MAVSAQEMGWNICQSQAAELTNDNRILGFYCANNSLSTHYTQNDYWINSKNFGSVILRKILVSVKFVSVKFVSAILGPEMAAPILWTPGKKKTFFLQENLCP